LLIYVGILIYKRVKCRPNKKFSSDVGDESQELNAKVPKRTIVGSSVARVDCLDGGRNLPVPPKPLCLKNGSANRMPSKSLYKPAMAQFQPVTGGLSQHKVPEAVSCVGSSGAASEVDDEVPATSTSSVVSMSPSTISNSMSGHNPCTFQDATASRSLEVLTQNLQMSPKEGNHQTAALGSDRAMTQQTYEPVFNNDLTQDSVETDGSDVDSLFSTPGTSSPKLQHTPCGPAIANCSPIGIILCDFID
jgi:hypothetical protein